MRWLAAPEEEEDLDRELRAHLELEAEEQRESGLPPRKPATPHSAPSATRPWSRRTPAPCGDGRPWSRGAWLQDFRHGLRLLRRSPVFTVFAVGSLGLGIGAAVAVFQLFDAIVLRRLPVPEPAQLVVASFGGGPPARFNYSMPYPHFEEIRRRNTTLAGIFATNPFGRVNVTFRGEPAIAEGIYVSGDYYPTLRLTPAAAGCSRPTTIARRTRRRC